MSDELERWLAYQRRYYSDLVEHDDGLPDHFDDLARRSEMHVVRMPWKPHWSPESAFTPTRDFDYGLPPELVDEWLAYGRRWRRFLAINSRLRLAEILSEISESHDASSFPVGREAVIRDWVRNGFATPRPFDDRWRLDCPEWREALSETASAAGSGWVFYQEPYQLVWRTDDEL